MKKQTNKIRKKARILATSFEYQFQKGGMVQLGQQLQVAGTGAVTFIWFETAKCGKVIISIFQQLFASINKVFILGGRLGTGL